MSLVLYGSEESRCYIEGYLLAPDTPVSGERVRLVSGGPSIFVDVVSFYFENELRVTIKETITGLHMYLDLTDNIVKWIDNFTNPDANIMIPFIFVSPPGTLWSPALTMSFYSPNEDNTRRYPWRREGDSIIGADDVVPARYGVYTSDTYADPENDVTSIGRFTFIPLTGTFVSAVPTNTMYYDDLNVLDGAIIKLGRAIATPGAPVVSQTIGMGIGYWAPTLPSRQFLLVDMNYNNAGSSGGNLDDTGFAWTQFQLRRLRDSFGVPNGLWEIWAGDYYKRLGTQTNRDLTYGYSVSAEATTLESGIGVSRFKWILNFDSSDKSISFENADLVNEGEPWTWMAPIDATDRKAIVAFESFANRFKFNLISLFVPIAYEKDRYENNTALLVQCCSATVDEIGPPPPGYEGNPENINYDVFCPSTHLPDSVSSLIKTTSSGVCDPLLIDWCQETENSTTSLCACLNPFDAPPLPDDSLITAFKRCFSQQCRDFGYRTAGMITNDGSLDCPDTLCVNILEIEEGSNVEFDEAKQIINCEGDGGGTDPETGLDTMTLIYIIVGVVVGLGLIIGLAVGIPAAIKGNKEEKRKEDAEDALLIQQAQQAQQQMRIRARQAQQEMRIRAQQAALAQQQAQQALVKV